jgi:hypothetical protein
MLHLYFSEIAVNYENIYLPLCKKLPQYDINSLYFTFLIVLNFELRT